MNILNRFLLAIILLILASAFVTAQDKKGFRLSSLDENATIAETQDWLIAALTQNSAYLAKTEQQTRNMGGKSTAVEVGYTDSKVSEVSFKGSVLTYKIVRSIQLNSAKSSSSNFPTGPQEDNTTVQVDLKDINPEEIALQEIDADSKMQNLSLRTYDFKRAIRLKSVDTGNVNVSVATLVIGGNIGEQVRTAFIHLVKLHQEPKP